MTKDVITIKDADGKSIYFDNPGAELSCKDGVATVTIPKQMKAEHQAGEVYNLKKLIGSFPGYISAIVASSDDVPANAAKPGNA